MLTTLVCVVECVVDDGVVLNVRVCAGEEGCGSGVATVVRAVEVTTVVVVASGDW